MGKVLFLLQVGFISSCFPYRSPRVSIYLHNYTKLMMSTMEENQCSLLTSIKDFTFSESKLLELPIEEIRHNYVRRNVRGAIFSYVDPTPLPSVKMVSYSRKTLEILDLSPDVGNTEDFINFVAGNNLLSSSIPLAHRYGGHQFGYWAMQLGDGRAILLGEYVNRKGEKWELQIKGAGKTPYSRDGDGRAVLRSSIREYLCSEAMHFLGIPTSRAAAVVVSEAKVMRDLLYDGHPKLENAAVVLRIAPTWFRIGSLELLAKNGEIDSLKILFNFIMKEHFADIADDKDRILVFISRVCRATADLVVAWQAIGFTHGVLNTDNVSLLGLTIDYGPFGFMESYDLKYVPNHSDSEAMYCYGKQIQIMLFNLLMFIRSLAPLMEAGQAESAAKILQAEAKYMEAQLEELFSKKLGFSSNQPDIVKDLLEMLNETKADFVMTFRQLSETPLEQLRKPARNIWALSELARHSNYTSFIEKYSQQIKNSGQTDEKRMDRMTRINPRYILRNWMAQEAINLAENGDYSEVNRLLRVLETPYSKQDEAETRGYASKPPSWSKSLQLSCSS